MTVQDTLDELSKSWPSKDASRRVIVLRRDVRERIREGYELDGAGLSIGDEHFVVMLRPAENRLEGVATAREEAMRGKPWFESEAHELASEPGTVVKALATLRRGLTLESLRHALIWLRVLPEYRPHFFMDRRMIKPWDDKQPGGVERVSELVRERLRDGMCKEMTWPQLVRHCERVVGYRARPWYVHRWFKS